MLAILTEGEAQLAGTPTEGLVTDESERLVSRAAKVRIKVAQVDPVLLTAIEVGDDIKRRAGSEVRQRAEDEGVTPRAAGQGVAARPADQEVVAAQSIQAVVTGVADQMVGEGVATP